MIKMTINGKDYKVKFGYNSFCDSDLLDEFDKIQKIFAENKVDYKSIRKLFCIVRDMLFEGFKKYNPVESKEEIGGLLDDYLEQCPEGENRGLTRLLDILSEELVEQGFLGQLLQDVQSEETQTEQTETQTEQGTLTGNQIQQADKITVIAQG